MFGSLHLARIARRCDSFSVRFAKATCLGALGGVVLMAGVGPSVAAAQAVGGPGNASVAPYTSDLSNCTDRGWVATGAGATTAAPCLTVSTSEPGFKVVRGRQVPVPFILSGPAKVTLSVLRGKRVVAMLSTTLRKGGHGSLTWNGKVDHKFAPTSAYEITLRAASPSGGSAHAAATVRIVDSGGGHQTDPRTCTGAC